MIRIIKYKTKAEDYDGSTREFYFYKALDGDIILCTYSVQADLPMADTMAKKRMGDFLLKNIKIEEITEQENKELEIKNKIAVVDGDFV